MTREQAEELKQRLEQANPGTQYTVLSTDRPSLTVTPYYVRLVSKPKR